MTGRARTRAARATPARKTRTILTLVDMIFEGVSDSQISDSQNLRHDDFAPVSQLQFQNVGLRRIVQTAPKELILKQLCGGINSFVRK